MKTRARTPEVRSAAFLLAGATLVMAGCGTEESFSQAAGAVWADEGALTWEPRPTEPAIVANDLRTHVYQLADDSMKGRATLSEGNWKTAEYMAREFDRLGLEPAGEDGTWFQELEYGELGFDRSEVELLVAGTPLEAGSDWAPLGPQAGAGLTGDFQGEGLETVFVGVWGDETAPIDAGMVAGKAAVFIAPAPPEGGVGGRGGRGGGGRGRGAAPASDPRAAEAGAALVLIVGGGFDAAAAEAAFGTRRGLMPFVESETAGALLSEAAGATLFGRPLSELRPGATGAVVSGGWDYRYDAGEFPVRNVIAVLPGSDPELADEYVLVGAHNDHVGMVGGGPIDHDSLRAFNRVMRPQGANDRPGAPSPAEQARIDSLIARARAIRAPTLDSVMNGADDDATGTALILEIAERFATEPAPARSIVFISHAAEEGGLLGSRYFTDHPTIPLDAIVAAHNLDMLGKGRVTDVKFGGPASVQMLGARRLSAEFGDIIDSLNAVRSEPMAIDYSWDRTNALNRFCRSDQVNYFRHTIPVTYFSLGYSVDYHQATDEPRYVDFEHSARVGRFVHEIMATIANRPTRLSVLPEEERDLSSRC